MTRPALDLTNLRSMTDGNAEWERQLLKEFHTLFAESTAVLAKSVTPEAEESWYLTCQRLKSAALNLGANSLGELCNHGQIHSEMSEPEKTELLGKLHSEYDRITALLAQSN